MQNDMGEWMETCYNQEVERYLVVFRSCGDIISLF